LRLIGPPPPHSAYRLYLNRYAEWIQERPGGSKTVQPGALRRRALGATKFLMDRVGLPYLRPHRNTASVLLAPQALLLTRSPWVVDIEHPTPFVGVDYLRFDRPQARWIITKLLERDNCLAVICWSEACRKAFLDKCSSAKVAAKVRVIYPAIDSALAAPRPSVRRRLRRLLFVFNTPQHNFFIKSGQEVVEAFRIARREVGELELHIVGPVPIEVSTKLAAVDGLTLYGKVSRERLSEVYSECDLMVLPTVTDTFGMAFLEAFATGMPALAIRWYAIPEIVAHEENGLLIDKSPGLLSWMDAAGAPTMHSHAFIRARSLAGADPQTARLLAEQIVRLARDPDLLSRLSAGASRTVREGKFSPATACAGLEAVARDIAARRGEGRGCASERRAPRRRGFRALLPTIRGLS
jgi:glycosyltransferase involved in cell wall biosynthesis